MHKPLIAIAALAIGLALGAPAFAQQDAGSPAPNYAMGPGMMSWGGGFGGMGAMGGMGLMARYPDGYLAFLKTELAITPAEASAWSKFADALRAQSANLGFGRGGGMMKGRTGGGAGMMGQGGYGPGMMGRGGYGPGMMSNNGQGWQAPALIDSLNDQVTFAEKRLAALKAVRDAAKPLYAKLSDDQKKRADRLLGGCPGCF